ncbi:MAG: HD domain-containing phosphohydrolase [Candidatus Thiodiazotropha taylori]
MPDSMKPRVLVVDDERFYIDLLVEMLSDSYQVQLAKNGQQALRRSASQNRPDLILLDVIMPDMDGYQVCEQLKSNVLTRNIPVIFLTSKSDAQDELRGLELGAVDYIAKPINPAVLKTRVATHVALAEQRFALQKLVDERTREVEHTKDALIFSMGAMAEMRDRETSSHLLRTGHFVRLLAEGLASRDRYRHILDTQTIVSIYRAAPLHDIGKIGVSDGILLKNGSLTEEEREQMQKHVDYGRELIEEAEARIGTTPFIRTAKEIAYHHHEKWDGTGYPKGLKGEEIPLSARLMAVADVYDAKVSQRYYKDAIPHETVVAQIQAASGKHFDPEIIEVFVEKQDSFYRIFEKYPK